jgi:hypothetical protein
MARLQARRPDMGRKPKAPQKSAVVALTISQKLIKKTSFVGKSSGQYGHAEMAALRVFIIMCEQAGQEPTEVIEAATSKKVKCPNQPVCNSCRLILQALGFKTMGGTKFSRKKSGGVSWGANNKVKQFMTDMGLGGVYSTALAAGRK